MTSGRRGRTRSAVVVLLQCLIVLACVGVTTAIAVDVQERSIRSATAERVLDVAYSLAELDQVHEAIGLERAEATAQLQPLATLIEEAAGVDYVVIADVEGVRLTHPVPAQRGEVVSTDPAEVLAGEVFLGTEEGTLGPTLRAKVPVVVGGEIVGAASVGILESEIAAQFTQAWSSLMPWVIASALLGALLSGILSAVLNRRIAGLERQVQELGVQRRIAEALREQTHEFRTRMHIVHGLVSAGEREEALEYIASTVPIDDGVERSLPIADARLRALFGALATELSEWGARMQADVPDDLGHADLGDDGMVVVANLCRNAGEAGATSVRVTLERAAGGVRVVVDDNGPGVPAELGMRIFQRGVSTKVDATGMGRGVGLDAVRSTVSARGGTIEVGRSSLGGARFTVELPPGGAG